nr:APC family permease [Solobacterium sp.]
FVASTVRLGGGFGSLVVDLAGTKLGLIYQTLFPLNVLSCSVMCVSATSYIAELIPVLNTPMGRSLLGIVIVIFFVLLNVKGIDLFARLQKVMTWILMGTLLIFAVFGLTHFHLPVFDFSGPEFMPNGFAVIKDGLLTGGFFSAIFLFIYSCNGYKGMITFGRVARNPQKDIPWVMLVTIPTLMVIYLSVTIAASGAVSLEEFGSSNTLVVAAQKLLPGILYPLFIICGPLMALFTTINANFAGYGIGIGQAARDGWLPSIFGKTNKNGAATNVYILVAVVGVLPVLLNYSITQVTSQLQLVTSLTGLMLDFSLFAFPKKHAEAWKQSKLHISDGLFYVITGLACSIQLITFIKSCMTLHKSVVIVSSIVIIAVVLYGVYCSKVRDLNVKLSVWEEWEQPEEKEA